MMRKTNNRLFMVAVFITAYISGLLAGCQGQSENHTGPLEAEVYEYSINNASNNVPKETEVTENQYELSLSDHDEFSSIQEIGESLEGTGLLLGLRSDGDDRDDPHSSAPLYDTIWLHIEQGELYALLFPQTLVWPSTTDSGTEALRLYELRSPEDVIRFVRYEPSGQGTKHLDLIFDVQVGNHITITERVTYLGSSGVSLNRRGSFWAGNAPVTTWASQVYAPSQLNANAGYSYEDFYTRESINIREVLNESTYQSAVEELKGQWEVDVDDDSKHIDINGTQWAIEHAEGEWKAVLYGTFSPQGGNKSLFGHVMPADPIIPESERGATLDWRRLSDVYPDARDAVLSPDGRLAVIVQNGALVVSIVEDGRYSLPLQTWPIRNHASIVMSRWSGGSQTDDWNERLQEHHLRGNDRYPGFRDETEQELASHYMLAD